MSSSRSRSWRQRHHGADRPQGCSGEPEQGRWQWRRRRWRFRQQTSRCVAFQLGIGHQKHAGQHDAAQQVAQPAAEQGLEVHVAQRPVAGAQVFRRLQHDRPAPHVSVNSRLLHRGGRVHSLGALKLLALLLQVHQHVVAQRLRLRQRPVPLLQARQAAVQRMTALQQLLPALGRVSWCGTPLSQEPARHTSGVAPAPSVGRAETTATAER
jgi:hypothetical protein